MKMNADDRRADELGRTDDEPARTDDEPDPTTGRDESDEELPPRRLRLGAAWRLPVILSAAAEMDQAETGDEQPDGH
ncbi:hypothetical protein ACTJI8_13595 [Microbacterium sp. 22303]|uniref:hypothetical protein n=1 Tax=Microbacterium sp. 22303 TaxID=3453905 RepID=UPI003F86E436